VVQGQPLVPILRFNMTTDTSQATWRKLMVEKTGSSSDVLKPYGRNRDVKFVRIFRDSNSNDAFDVSDLPVSAQKAVLAAAVSSTTVVPFYLVLESTAGFPASGDIMLSDTELMHYASISTSAASLRITERSMAVGVTASPTIGAAPGAVVEKVDFFEQSDDNNRVRLIELAVPQLLSPSQQTYFLTYDIGDAASVGNGVGVKIPGPNAIVIDQNPDTVNGRVNVGVSQFPQLPFGTHSQDLPFETMKALVGGTILEVSGISLAPATVEPGTQDITFMRLAFQTKDGAVDVGALRLTQTGDRYCTDAAACDLTSISLYLDSDGNGVYSPGDTLLGKTDQVYQPGGSAAFDLGIATVPLSLDGLPRLRVDTTRSLLFVVGTVGVSTTTVGHRVGLSLATYGDVKAPGGLMGLSAIPDALKQPPVSSELVVINSLVIPAVAISSNAAPVIITLAAPGTPDVAVGYPAYAKMDPVTCNNGKDAALPRNNICRDAANNYVPDQTRWICADGRPWLIGCPQEHPLLDVNGDGAPDNFSSGSDPRLTRISLIGDSNPSLDIVGERFLEIDLNQDGIPDQVQVSPTGARQMLLGTDALDPAKTLPAPDQAFVPSAWTGSGQQLKATLPMVSAEEGYYEVAAGRFYDEPASLSGTWRRAGSAVSTVKGLRASSFAALAAGAPLTTASIGSLALPVPNVARLTQNIGISDTSFTVDDSAGLKLPGLIYVGSEIMRLGRKQGASNTLEVIPSETDSGRGLKGSSPIDHLGSALGGEPLSDDAAIFSARFVSIAGSTASVSATRALFVFRFDPKAPTVPGAPKPQMSQGAQTTYEIKWTPSQQAVSGVAGYEVQERGGAVTDLQANVVWRPLGFVPGRAPSYFAGSALFPGEAPRPQNQFYLYRTRSVSNAGIYSEWSILDSAVATGVLTEVLSAVTNYPNPFDPRKGGAEAKTYIAYTLADNSEVTITLYDLLGYMVKEFKFSSGSEGARPGPNTVTWDGRNDLGGFVSKGGYIARVKASSSKGSKIIIRKIGVIH
jgi:hypothetical protein